MKVYKFGGASISNEERISALVPILKENEKPLLLIISAMGKTTNALEKVVEAFCTGHQNEALMLFEKIKKQHNTLAKYLLVTTALECDEKLKEFYTEIEWLLHGSADREYDFYYDQVVCVGELLSTCIMSYYFREMGLANNWLDVRDLLRTDNNFRDAAIDWPGTSEKINAIVKPLLTPNNIVITQGFIGSTSENESTTLGREGSDFTAAVFANILDAESVTIWKDVPGVMNADPKQFPEAVLIPDLSFNEVIEMAFYGAQVIHPKTIKPLENKNIPLYVKCFSDTCLPGTIISKKQNKKMPPVIVMKQNQALIHLHTKDLSFIGGKPMGHLYTIFEELKIKPNLIQTGAVNVQVCLDDVRDKIEVFALAAEKDFEVSVEKGLQLLTIRHCPEGLLEKMTSGKNILLTQKSPETVQALFR
ncbi:MAG: aspartate kinase [Bacteroidetes bacterium]|nr:aspartate kinase [Bacteroidota bacterium]